MKSSRLICLATAALAAGIVLVPLIATRASAQEAAPTYTVLYNFTGGADGAYPGAGLIADAAGNLYGTASGGGNTGSSCASGSSGCGLVFKVDPAGNETVLYSFTGGADGSVPFASLIRDAAGNLYGTTYYGGNFGSQCGSPGCGVVFKLDPAGTETVLYSFTGGADGANPQAGLIADAAGNLYGTTLLGGNFGSQCGSPGCGVVFKVDPSGKETVLYTFTGGPDGSYPDAGLIRDPVGNLYGTAQDGGNTSSSCPNGSGGCGVVFKLDPRGQHYRVLYTFSGGADGSFPYAPLVRDAAGNLYGTTGYGGNFSSPCDTLAPSGCGVVFKLDSLGNESVLYAFTGGSDGFRLFAGVVRDRAGDLYGATFSGGNFSGSCSAFGCGVVFRLTPSGKETVLHSFSGTDGAGPGPSGLLLLDKGSLYGTTNYDGAYGYGVVFKLH